MVLDRFQAMYERLRDELDRDSYQNFIHYTSKKPKTKFRVAWQRFCYNHCMHTIVALGNPGTEYETTRHNAGQVVMSDVLRAWGWGDPYPSGKLGGRSVEGVVAGKEVRVIYPDVFMNHSGRAVKKSFDRSDTDSLLVVYDDVDLPLGTLKLSYGRGAGGHNGLASIITELGTMDFARLRIGIAPVNWFGRTVRPRAEQLADYVLGGLTRRERDKLQAVARDAAAAIELLLSKGKEVAMTRFNQ